MESEIQPMHHRKFEMLNYIAQLARNQITTLLIELFITQELNYQG